MATPQDLSSPTAFCDEVPQEVKHSENQLERDALVQSTTACEMASEVLEVDTDDIEAGSSFEQPLVVIQQAVCGGEEPPQLCEYEQLRERNIRERDEAMKEAMGEIEEAKQNMRDNAPGAKGPSEEVSDWRRKSEDVDSVEVVEVRRDRKPLSYVVEEDIGGRSRKRRRIAGVRSRVQSTKPARKACGKSSSKPDSPPNLASFTLNLRPRKPINYAEVPELEADGFIWCFTCNKKQYHGCEEHSPYFGDNKEFRLEVEKSSMGRNAGDGVVNRGKVIPKGVLFGPYAGRFIPSAIYKKMELANMESGNAWEIRDKYTMKTLGYIDPGVNPDPKLHWMAKINCPNKGKAQNLVAFQLAGQIYYRVKENILWGEELLVWYGKAYAEKMGIDMETLEQFTRKKDHTKEASVCRYCHTGMEGERELEEHLGKGDGHAYRCGVKQAMEMVRMAKSGERKSVCKVCGKGFKKHSSLMVHNSVHTKQKAFVCDVEGCDKSYTGKAGLIKHKNVVHEGSFHECLECGKRFGQKSSMTTHYKTVHEEKKNYKCVVCGVQFSQKSRP